MQCLQVVERLERIGITKEEFCILKSLVLVNADTRIEEHVSVKKLRDTILSSLCDCVAVLRYILIFWFYKKVGIRLKL